MAKEKLLIFPFNGNGLEALHCLGDTFDLIGFVDDTPSKQGKTAQGIDVLSREAFINFPDARVLAVPGSAVSYLKRESLIASLNLPPLRFARVIHPKASVSPMAQLGYNILIMAGVVITSNAVIGNHVCVLPNTVIHHDVTIGDHSLIGSNVTVAGGSHIGSTCYIGSGTSVINGIRIGNGSLIGLGSNVIRDLANNSKAAGNPARLLS